ncbi:NAD(P)-dependent dehydrogenase (short-subunit alcohol dehydrogenase family) [Pseudacidovorax sp. 1753]|uniref:SDR family NAD(P)-dependent oxidoreductase n=1 Tax=Pseudacidovorax sp. 1753 TaxID=3156419 RepID=UPI0033915269
MRRFDGLTALVTGGGSGIGAAVVRRLADEGARVAVVDRDSEQARAVSTELGGLGLALTADVREEAAVARAVADAVGHFGGVDVAVNAAGYGAAAEVVDMTLEQWRGVMDVDLSGVFLSTKHQARQMLRQGRGGVIVNIASTNAEQPAEGLAAYCAAKAGVVMFTQVAALELAAHGIRVVGVGPGLTETPATAALLQTSGALAAYLDNIAAGRPAQVAEIAGLVAYLASPEAAYISGETVYIDGGLRARSYPTLRQRRGEAYAGSAFLRGQA